MKNKCTAVQMSDQMMCSQCNHTWDVNDVCRPDCNSVLANEMTLRDHFAGLAMQGAIACAFLSEDVSESDYAMWAYRYADAMMDERLK